MGSTYVVTGANRGIGLELARQLLERGDAVVATTRRLEQAAQLRSLGVRVEVLDVASAASVRAFAGELAGAPVDVLINNAGVAPETRGLAELDCEGLLEAFSINSVGALRVTQALLPNLRAARRRQVFNLSSQLASIGDNASGGYYAYRASKAALNMLTRTLALELAGKGFTCVAVNPGWVRTRMGGASAPLPVAESAAGMLALFDRLTVRDSGGFFSWDGARVAW